MDLYKIREKFYNTQVEKDGLKCVVIKKNNKINIEGFFKEVEDYTQSKDTKYFITNYKIEQGEYIEYNNNKFLVIQKTENTNNSCYNKYVVVLCNVTFKLNFAGDIREYWGCASGNIFRLDNNSNNPFTFANGNINILTTNIAEKVIDLRLIKYGSAWKITGDNRTATGLINLTLEKDSFCDKDDKENGIADRWKNETKYTYVFNINSKLIELKEEDQSKIEYEIIENGNKVDNIVAKIEINNDNIIVQDNIITAKKQGTSIITLSFVGKDNKTYTDTINVIVREKEVAPEVGDNFTYNIDANMGFAIKKFNNNTFVAKKYNNAIEVEDWKPEFSFIFGGLDTSKLEFNKIDYKTLKIKNKSYINGETFYLIVKEDEKEVCRKEIKLIK